MTVVRSFVNSARLVRAAATSSPVAKPSATIASAVASIVSTGSASPRLPVDVGALHHPHARPRDPSFEEEAEEFPPDHRIPPWLSSTLG